MPKPRIQFPYEYVKNGRVGKIYALPATNTFKTYFRYAGQPHQNTFKTVEAAVMFLEKEFSRLDTDRANSLLLNPLNSDVRVYSELEQLLRDKGDGATLREAVQFYISHHAHKRLVPTTVERCAEKFVASQRANNVSPIHIQTLEKHFRRFSRDYGTRKVHTLAASEIGEWISRQRDEASGSLWSVKTRTSNLGSLVSLSLFARDMLQAIPDLGKTEFQKVRRPKKEQRAAVDIYTPDEMMRLLLAAVETDLTLIAGLVVGGFQGLRPFEFHAENANRPPLDWKAVNWGDGFLHVTGQKIRSKATRDIPLHPVTRAWLEPLRESRGPMWTFKQSHTARMIALKKRASVPSIYDGLRHSYASYRIRHLKSNLPLLAAEMGNSPQELIDSYKRNVTDAEADAWFDLFPPKTYKKQAEAALSLRKPASL
jgi:integrase